MQVAVEEFYGKLIGRFTELRRHDDDDDDDDDQGDLNKLADT